MGCPNISSIHVDGPLVEPAHACVVVCAIHAAAFRPTYHPAGGVVESALARGCTANGRSAVILPADPAVGLVRCAQRRGRLIEQLVNSAFVVQPWGGAAHGDAVDRDLVGGRVRGSDQYRPGVRPRWDAPSRTLATTPCGIPVDGVARSTRGAWGYERRVGAAARLARRSARPAVHAADPTGTPAPELDDLSEGSDQGGVAPCEVVVVPTGKGAVLEVPGPCRGSWSTISPSSCGGQVSARTWTPSLRSHPVPSSTTGSSTAYLSALSSARATSIAVRWCIALAW